RYRGERGFPTMLNDASAPTETLPLFDALSAIVGAENMIDGASERTFFSADLAESGKLVSAVIRPQSVTQVSEAVKLCAERGLPMIPRGGGFSYTGGYRPVAENTVMFDLRALDQIIEI